MLRATEYGLEIQLVVIGVKGAHKVKNFFLNLIRTAIWLIHFIDHHDGLLAKLESLVKEKEAQLAQMQKELTFPDCDAAQAHIDALEKQYQKMTQSLEQARTHAQTQAAEIQRIKGGIEGQEEILRGAEARWKARPFWERAELIRKDKTALALFFAPAAARHSETAKAFAGLLQERWNGRFPRARFLAGDYEKIMLGFDKDFLGIKLRKSKNRG